MSTLKSVPDCPINCAICYTKAEVYLNCGHLCCDSCLHQMRQITQSLRCMVCRVESSLDTTVALMIPDDFDYNCYTCLKQKLWVANCGHVTCFCNARCFQCDQPITTMKNSCFSVCGGNKILWKMLFGRVRVCVRPGQSCLD
uniref:RING-type domain-containing protein n=1 Tax=Sparus aurata TaxID=8175 RepID=A0A671UAX1_SPAAU